jgi:hypothetical protein
VSELGGGIINYKDPMILIPANHDLGQKTLLNYPGAQNTVIRPARAARRMKK